MDGIFAVKRILHSHSFIVVVWMNVNPRFRAMQESLSLENVTSEPSVAERARESPSPFMVVLGIYEPIARKWQQ